MAFKISFDITDETCREIDQEAADAGLARSPYLKRIIEQRHEKGITIRPNDPSVTSRLEGIIETLKEQNSDLNDRLSRVSEKAGLAGLEKKNNVNETTLAEYGMKLKQEWQTELDQRELLELRQYRDKAETRIQELEDHKASNDKFDKALSGIKEVVNSNPVILTGLMGMVGMKLPLVTRLVLGALPKMNAPYALAGP